MATHIIAGLIAGLVTALLFALSLRGAALALLLSPFLTLPGFVAVLGWGDRAAWIAVSLAVLCIGALHGFDGALSYSAAYGLPVLLLGHFALLFREAPAETPGGSPALEWYPPGRLLAWATLLSTAYAALAIVLIASQFSSFESAIGAFIDTSVMPQLDEATRAGLSAEQKAGLSALLASWLPGMMAAVWLAITVFNLYAAGRLLLGAQLLRRPWPDLSGLEPPQILPLTLAASLAGSLLLSGSVRLVANAALASHLVAYLLIGLAVLHRLSRRSNSRPFVLLGTYLSLAILGPIPAVALIVLGLLDAVFHLRRRQDRATPGHPGG